MPITRTIIPFSLSSLLMIACGDGGEPTAPVDARPSPIDARLPVDGPEAGDAATPDASCADCEPLAILTLFVFDQDLDRIVRLADENGDGDLLDADEATIFFDNATPPLGVYNAQGLVAVGPNELLATDNVTSENADANVVRLVDANADGDALDEGEATLWYGGAIPGGGQVTFPTALTRAPDGAFYLVNNDAFDDQPDAVYRLDDANADGDVDDAGEATLHFDLATRDPVPQTFDLVFDAAGQSYVVDIRTPTENNASVDAIAADGSAMTEILDAVALYTLTQSDEELALPGFGSNQIAYNAQRDALVFSTVTVFQPFIPHVVALRDENQNGMIDDRAEVRILWDAELADVADFGGVRDLLWVPDGTILIVDNGEKQILRLIDDNADGDFNDAGETRVIYDLDRAMMAGHPATEDLFTTAVWTE